MTFLGSMLGTRSGNSGGSGLNYQAEKVPLQQATNANQVGNLYGQTQSGLGQQQAFLNALQGQNGLGHQNNVFAMQNALAQQQAAQNGVANQGNVFQQQQGLANQLQGVANGTGPNPALAQLQQATGQNVANQAALMAGQRGAGANAGLLARQAAMQGGNLQQQAVGQGAALQAQQQLAGLNALQQQQSAMGSLASNQVAQQQNQQQMLAGLSNQQVGQQQGALTGYNQAAQSEQQNLLGALGQYNNANVGMQSNVNNANAGIAGQAAQAQKDLVGGLFGGAGQALGLARGGMVPRYAEGGPVSAAGRYLYGSAPLNQGSSEMNMAPPMMPTSNSNQDQSPLKGLMAGATKIIASNPEILAASEGKMVSGKAQIKGDSLKNDTVPAMLSPREIVIPRHITMSENAPEKAKQFVAAILAKNGMGRKSK